MIPLEFQKFQFTDLLVLKAKIHYMIKDTHWEKAPSIEAPALTNMGIWFVVTSNQLFVIGS